MDLFLSWILIYITGIIFIIFYDKNKVIGHFICLLGSFLFEVFILSSNYKSLIFLGILIIFYHAIKGIVFIRRLK